MGGHGISQNIILRSRGKLTRNQGVCRVRSAWRVGKVGRLWKETQSEAQEGPSKALKKLYEALKALYEDLKGPCKALAVWGAFF